MTAPTAKMFLIPPGKTWTTTLVGVAATDVIVPNGTTFTAEASGATGNQFNVGASVSATAVNLASALNSSSDVNTEFTAYPTGPFSLALASLANDDTLSINGTQVKAKTSGADHTASPPEFNLASDHGAADLAKLINGEYGTLANVTGYLGATSSSTTVTLTGTLTKWTPPGTASHAVMTAASGVVTIKGGLYSYDATIASGSATLRAIAAPGQSVTCNVNITGGSSDDSVNSVEPIAEGAGTTTSSLSFDLGVSGIQPSQALAVPASSTSKYAAFGVNGYQYQWDGSTFDYSITAILNFQAAGSITATSALLSLVNPTVATEG